ncbi:MAG: hypothetical protein H7247_18570 [Polaromonas sp.]|nr:hypothetical protein [Gemmatimonadaceae bacterium]
MRHGDRRSVSRRSGLRNFWLQAGIPQYGERWSEGVEAAAILRVHNHEQMPGLGASGS